MRTHGQSRADDGRRPSPTYYAWVAMKKRCFNKKDSHHKNYGARGITVCQRWLDFANFLADMGERPAGMTLDRIDNDGNYEPGNCRWASHEQQRNNTRFTKFLELDGKRLGVSQWSRLLAIKRETIWARIKSGLPTDKVLSTEDLRKERQP